MKSYQSYLLCTAVVKATERRYSCRAFLSRHDLQIKKWFWKQLQGNKQCSRSLWQLAQNYNSEGNPGKKNRPLFLVSFSQVYWVAALFYKSNESSVWKESYSWENYCISMRCWLCGLHNDMIDVSFYWMWCFVCFSMQYIPKKGYFKQQFKNISVPC